MMSIRNTITTIQLCALLALPLIAQAQVKMGGEVSPAQGAILDLKKDAEKHYLGGLLLPNVELFDLRYIPTSFTDAVDMDGYNSSNGVDTNTSLSGMVVYNTRENDNKGIEKGIYFWDGENWNIFALSHPCEIPEVTSIAAGQRRYTTSGIPVSLSVEVANKNNTTYQWYSSSVNSTTNYSLINGATDATYTWTPTANTAIGDYHFYCVVTNNCGGRPEPTTSAIFTVQVCGTGTASFTGNTCLDIAKGNDDVDGCGSVADRQSNRTDFAPEGQDFHTEVYTFNLPNAGNPSMSTLSFSFVDEEGDIVDHIDPISYNSPSKGSDYTVTVYFKRELNERLKGLNKEDAKVLRLYAIYTVANGTAYVIPITISLQDCVCN